MHGDRRQQRGCSRHGKHHQHQPLCRPQPPSTNPEMGEKISSWHRPQTKLRTAGRLLFWLRMVLPLLQGQKTEDFWAASHTLQHQALEGSLWYKRVGTLGTCWGSGVYLSPLILFFCLEHRLWRVGKKPACRSGLKQAA